MTARVRERIRNGVEQPREPASGLLAKLGLEHRTQAAVPATRLLGGHPRQIVRRSRLCQTYDVRLPVDHHSTPLR